MKVEGIQLNSTHAVDYGISGQGSRPARPQRPVTREARMYSDKETDASPDKEISVEQLQKAVEKANKSFKPFDRRFERAYHEKTKTVMVKVIDAVSDEVIREIPPEKILDMVAYMWEIAGILVDEKV